MAMKEIYHTNDYMFDDHITDFYTKQKLIWMNDPGRPSEIFFQTESYRPVAMVSLIFWAPIFMDLIKITVSMIDQFVVNDSINTTFYLKMHFKENLILWINSTTKINENLYSTNTDETPAYNFFFFGY